MDTISMILILISDSHRLLLNLTDKIDFRRKDILCNQILTFTVHGKNKKVI